MDFKLTKLFCAKKQSCFEIFIPWRHLDDTTKKILFYWKIQAMCKLLMIVIIQCALPHCKNGVFQSEFDNVTPSVGKALRAE